MLFAGLAMMLFGLLKKIKTPLWGIALVAITMSILGTIFKGYHIDNIWLNCISGWFIGMLDSTLMDTFSNFPLFNWFIMVVAGYAFAELFKKVKDKKSFYLVFSSISLVAVCLYCVFGIPNHIGVFGESFVCTYHITIFDALISICGAVFVLGVYYFVSRILPKFVLSFATMLSKNINTIYCIQWIIYGNVPVILYAFANEFTFDVGYVLLIAVGVLIFSVVIAWAYKKVLAKLVNKKTKTESAEVN